MELSLTPETQRVLEEQLQKSGFESADELVRFALEQLTEVRGCDYEDLDEETRAAIERADAQFERGEWMTIEEARERLMRKHFGK